ncbi:tetratricopeptide repeat protein [Maribacter sp. 2210JD10-5]|uniref:tetratricopeptide repeat protein n=1 Tax=Maribacter sp. 2210JD10-5 TaxID=3386272 RepID=UPI0039BD436D
MKLKIYFTAIMLFGIMGVSNAQAQDPECMTNLSIFSEHAKVKNYDAAYEPFKKVYEKCPQLNNAIYVYGERILKAKIEKATGAEKEGFINELMGLYDNKLKYFAKKTSMAETIVDKAKLKYDNKMTNDAEMYEMLGEAFSKDAENFKDPKALYIYFSSLVDLHGEGKKDLQEVFDVYDDVTGRIEEENDILTDKIAKLLPKEEAGTLTAKEKKYLKSYNSYSEVYGKISGSIDTKLGNLADCENLIPLYTKNFEEKKGDVKWVKGAVSRMFSKECTDDPLFKKMVAVQAELDPSADVYVYLGSLDSKSGDTKGAVANFNKALELEADAKKRSNIAYKVATIYRRGSKSTARKYAQQALDANPANGKAYLLIASLYNSSANECGATPFEKRAIYWKAAEIARQAGRVDPSLRGRANQSAASYSAKAPTKEMIFSSGMAGKTVTFSCWVGGSVKVPNL